MPGLFKSSGIYLPTIETTLRTLRQVQVGGRSSSTSSPGTVEIEIFMSLSFDGIHNCLIDFTVWHLCQHMRFTIWVKEAFDRGPWLTVVLKKTNKSLNFKLLSSPSGTSEWLATDTWLNISAVSLIWDPIPMGFCPRGVWVMVYCRFMGYGVKFSAHQLGGLKNVWDLGVYGLSDVWVMRVPTVFTCVVVCLWISESPDE